ncbi:alpha/beta fold hydrolase [Nocardia sp. CY41]|uniref:alpha/beta fold hydrolase n=1 Tax=Nocardia sp. CY41 TaxID=2608686 RepID=UPI003FA56F30
MVAKPSTGQRRSRRHGRDGCPLHATVVGAGPALILMHAGGPDHESMLPLAERLADRHMVVLPDLRGYGRSVCTDPARHTLAQYSADLVSLLDHLGLPTAACGGAGLGSTITLRAAAEHPQRVHAGVLIGVEDIEDDAAKEEEIRFLDASPIGWRRTASRRDGRRSWPVSRLWSALWCVTRYPDRILRASSPPRPLAVKDLFATSPNWSRSPQLRRRSGHHVRHPGSRRGSGSRDAREWVSWSAAGLGRQTAGSAAALHSAPAGCAGSAA